MSGRRARLKKGDEISVGGVRCRFRKAASATEVLVQVIGTGERRQVKLADIAPPLAQAEGQDARPLEALPAKDVEEARRRFAVIEPLLSVSGKRIAANNARAAEVGISAVTIGRWLSRYEKRGLLSDLAPRRRGRDMPNRLDPGVEKIIGDVLDEYFLSMQKPGQKKVYEEVLHRCCKRGLPVPHRNTVRKRLKAVPPHETLRRREGKKAAHDRHGEIRGQFPEGRWPLDVVQIDHTKMDIVLVDERDRQPIGRPWLTLAMDVFSRTVAGLHLSLEHPSALSVGMCLSHAILPKDDYLLGLGIEGEWPVHGMMKCLHADNGKEFRCESIGLACDEYGVRIEWRPVKTPHYGGHIERLLGTVAKEIHALPGTTFANVAKKGDYDSDGNAILTLRQLEKLLVDFIVNVYHRREHRALDIPPLEKWTRGIVGDRNAPGVGLPMRVEDEKRLRISFLPSERRSVQRNGISWDNVTYYSEFLRPWIGAKKGSVTEKFLVRRDPRDVGRIYFLDPTLKEYLEIPYRNLIHPSVSIWEIGEARRRLKEEGAAHVDEARLFEAIARRKEIIDAASRETKKARRNRQRRVEAARQIGAGAGRHLSIVTEKGGGPSLTAGSPPPAPWDEFGDDDEFDLGEEDMKPRYKERD